MLRPSTLEVEGEAFAKKCLGMTDEIKTQMLHPYRISGDVGKACSKKLT